MTSATRKDSIHVRKKKERKKIKERKKNIQGGKCSRSALVPVPRVKEPRKARKEGASRSPPFRSGYPRYRT